MNGLLVICDGEMGGQSFMLDRPVITIGRGFECDVAINDASISRRHAQVSRQANGHYVQDLASRNGSKVNNDPLLATKLLQHGDIVCLGSVRLEYMLSLQDDAGIPLSSPTIRPLLLASDHNSPAPFTVPSSPK